MAGGQAQDLHGGPVQISYATVFGCVCLCVGVFMCLGVGVWVFVFVCLCVWVCLCVSMRERERERERSHVHMLVSLHLHRLGSVVCQQLLCHQGCKIHADKVALRSCYLSISSQYSAHGHSSDRTLTYTLSELHLAQDNRCLRPL